MSRPNSTGSFYASKSLSLRSSTIGGRSNPSGLNASASGGVATFISSRQHRPTSFQRIASRPEIRDRSSEEPEEGGGVGVKYNTQEQYEHASSPPGKQEQDEDEDDYEDSMSVASRASTPRQRSRDVRFTAGSSVGPLKPQNPMPRIPDFQQMFDNEEYDVFEDEDTPSFSETTVTIPNKVLDNMRLPLPTPGQSTMDSPAPWGKMSRDQSEDSEIVEIKQEVFHARHDSGSASGKTGAEKVSNTEKRLDIAAWQEGDDEEEEVRRGESILSSDYESKHGEADYEEEPIQQQDGTEYCHTEYSDGNEGSDDERKDDTGIWSEGSPTISSRGWLGHRDKGSLDNIPLQKPLGEPGFYDDWKGKGKAREQYPEQMYSNEVQRLDYRSQKPNLLPLALRDNRPRVDTPTSDHMELSPLARAEMAVQAAGRGSHTTSGKEVTVFPERKKDNEEKSHRVAAVCGNEIDLTVLLSDSELSLIPTYADLLTHLKNLHSRTQTTIPSTQLPSELDELAKSYYPHDPHKPEKFFNKLDDKQHAIAGEYILSKKRELEEQLAGVAAKRRRICEGMKGEVEKAAEVRVVKLKKTEERRELLKGGIGRMLREGGLWL